MGQGTGVPPLGRHQLLRMFPLRLLLVLCPGIPMARPGGLWAHWLSRGGIPAPATKSFPCMGTSPVAQPSWQDTRGLGRCFPVPLLRPCTSGSHEKPALLPAPHPKKSNFQVSWDGATSSHAALRLPGLSLHTPIPGEDLACPECPQLPGKAKSSCLDLAGARFSSGN